MELKRGTGGGNMHGTDLRLGPFWYTGPESRSSSVTAQGRLARMGRSLWTMI